MCTTKYTPSGLMCQEAICHEWSLAVSPSVSQSFSQSVESLLARAYFFFCFFKSLFFHRRFCTTLTLSSCWQWDLLLLFYTMTLPNVIMMMLLQLLLLLFWVVRFGPCFFQKIRYLFMDVCKCMYVNWFVRYMQRDSVVCYCCFSVDMMLLSLLLTLDWLHSIVTCIVGIRTPGELCQLAN